MSARPDTWMPMYWGDYARDTGHLNAAGHGAYLMLIKHYWCSGGPLRDDDDELWRVACCDSKKDWQKLKPKIVRLFMKDGELFRHKRVDQELARALDLTNSKAEAGRKGAERRWQKDAKPIAEPLATPIAVPMAEPSVRHRQTDAPSPSPSPVEEDSSLRSAPTARESLFAEGLAIVQELTGKPRNSAASLVGGWLKSAGNDHGRVLSVIRQAAEERPIEPVSWIVATLRARPNGHDLLTIGTENGRQVVGGYYLDNVAPRLAAAAGMSSVSDTDKTMIQWLADGIEPDDFLPVVRRLAERDGYQAPRSVAYFDQAIREAVRSHAA